MSSKDPQDTRVPKKLSRRVERDPRIIWLVFGILAAMIAAGWALLFLSY